MKATECCGATDREMSDKGPSYEDVGICPDCHDHAEFVTLCDECSEEECVCPPEEQDKQVNSLLGTLKEYVTPQMVRQAVWGIALAFATAAFIAAPWLADNSELAWGAGR